MTVSPGQPFHLSILIGKDSLLSSIQLSNVLKKHEFTCNWGYPYIYNPFLDHWDSCGCWLSHIFEGFPIPWLVHPWSQSLQWHGPLRAGVGRRANAKRCVFSDGFRWRKWYYPPMQGNPWDNDVVASMGIYHGFIIGITGIVSGIIYMGWDMDMKIAVLFGVMTNLLVSRVGYILSHLRMAKSGGDMIKNWLLNFGILTNQNGGKWLTNKSYSSCLKWWKQNGPSLWMIGTV